MHRLHGLALQSRVGTLYARLGQPGQARPTLVAASALYYAMERTFWLPQAVVALACAACQSSLSHTANWDLLSFWLPKVFLRVVRSVWTPPLPHTARSMLGIATAVIKEL